MNRNVINKILILIIGSFLVSCEKDLDLIPQTQYSEVSFFKTEDDFKLFTNQFYFQSFPVFSGMVGRDTHSDILASWGVDNISNGSYSPTLSSSLWKSSYSIIRNTAYLLGKIESANKELQSKISRYEGEARFFRALAYFNLFKEYGGIPIIDKVLNLDDEDFLYGPRNSRAEVVEYIISDLDLAINLLPIESEIPMNDKGRVSKGAALNLKARITLFEGTWRKFRGENGNALLDMAIEASSRIINSKEYQIFNRKDVLGNESYRYFFILDKVQTNAANLTKLDQKEYILVNRFDRDMRPSDGLFWPGKIPSITKKFADMFLCTDGLPIEKSPLFLGRDSVLTEYQNRDIRMINILLLPFARFWAPPIDVRNWSNPDAGGTPNSVNFGSFSRTGYFSQKFRPEIQFPSGVDYPVMRYAEVLLIYAEALFERNENITDEQLDKSINLIRDRGNIVKLSNSLVSDNGLDMREEIRRERTIELFMEGFRFDDLRRWKTAEIEMPMALRGVLWTGTQFETDPRWKNIHFPLDEDGYVIIEPASNRSFKEKHYLSPLPTRQLLLNPQLEQNPGWE